MGMTIWRDDVTVYYRPRGLVLGLMRFLPKTGGDVGSNARNRGSGEVAMAFWFRETESRGGGTLGRFSLDVPYSAPNVSGALAKGFNIEEYCGGSMSGEQGNMNALLTSLGCLRDHTWGTSVSSTSM